MSFLIITGPTGVGKSDLALDVAQQLNGEIVNADVGQLYAPLSIGTAKPDLSRVPVAHHLFDVVDQPHNITVAEYRRRALEVIEDIRRRGNLPIIVGGSSFYVKSLLYPPHELTLEQEVPELSGSAQQLWQQLHEIDPVRAQQIDMYDVYRVKRALAIWYTTKQKPSDLKPAFDPSDNFIFVFVTRERNELYTRIDERVKKMLAAGWIDEVADLSPAWHEFLKNKKLIGYDDIIAYVERGTAQQSYDELVETIAQKTRNYAKRQLSFWRNLCKQLAQDIPQKPHLLADIVQVNLTLLSHHLYINLIIDAVKNQKERVEK